MVAPLLFIALLECKEALRVRRSTRTTLRGLKVRLALLLFLTTGLLLRVGADLVVLILRGDVTPFNLAICHVVPSLVMLTSYSLAAVFFADVCRTNDRTLLTPLLIGSNALLYVIFFTVTSITKIHHAHREFRTAAFFVLGVSHVALAVVWCYYGVRLSLKLKHRRDRGDAFVTTDNETPQRTSPSFNSISNESQPLYRTPPDTEPENIVRVSASAAVIYLKGSIHHSSSDGETGSVIVTPPQNATSQLTALLWRLLLMATLCPPAFLLNGCLELYVSEELIWDPVSTGPDMVATWSKLAAALFLSEMLPVLIVLLAVAPRASLVQEFRRFTEEWRSQLSQPLL